jgi:hypothetical protein
MVAQLQQTNFALFSLILRHHWVPIMLLSAQISKLFTCKSRCIHSDFFSHRTLNSLCLFENECAARGEPTNFLIALLLIA